MKTMYKKNNNGFWCRSRHSIVMYFSIMYGRAHAYIYMHACGFMLCYLLFTSLELISTGTKYIQIFIIHSPLYIHNTVGFFCFCFTRMEFICSLLSDTKSMHNAHGNIYNVS